MTHAATRRPVHSRDASRVRKKTSFNEKSKQANKVGKSAPDTRRKINKEGKRTSIGATVDGDFARGRILVVDKVLPEGENS